jgi:hypothetical protein
VSDVAGRADFRDAIYSLDTAARRKETTEDRSLPQIDALLDRLKRWRANHPFLPPGRAGVPMLSKDHFEMEYHNVSAVMTQADNSAFKCFFDRS